MKVYHIMNELSIQTAKHGVSNEILQGIEYDLWEYLSRTKKQIVMYGMGNGADKILSVCAERGIEVEDFFASDGFVRGHSFHGKTVLSYSDIKEKYGCENIIVLLSFATSLDDVLENIYRISSECELYAPDVPVYGNTLFDMSFAKANIQALTETESLFADSESVRIYREITAYKLTGDISHLRACESDKSECYKDILHAEDFKYFADLGAYNGDSIRELLPYAPDLQKVYAMEPDPRNFRKLNEYYSFLTSPSFELISCKCGAWSHEDTLCFDKSGNRNSGLLENASSFCADINSRAKKLTAVNVRALDSLLDGARVDYIKYDVEGSEREALLGSQKTIKAHTPALLVSLYHRSEDMLTLPKLVKQIEPSYKLYLRRMKYLPAWDINLYAVK